ncbi:hypothetical protein EBU99_11350 [bacterium]|nr:hypothetical protein [bacterium]
MLMTALFPIASLLALLSPAGDARGQTIEQSSMANLGEPTTVSCLLTMMKAKANDPHAIERMAHTCNDFTVANTTEYDLVVAGCRLSHVLQGWAYRIENEGCNQNRAYARCRVMVDPSHSDSVDTYYYLGANSSSKKNAGDEELFRTNCNTLGGEFIK